MNQFPKVSWAAWSSGEFQRQFESYFNDHFGFRNTLIRARNQIIFSIFRESPNDQVLVGEKNHLFFRQYLKEYLLEPALTEKEFLKISESIKSLQDESQKRGVKFLFFIGPEKGTVYPEYLPFPYSVASRIASPYYHRISPYLKTAGINYLDTIALLGSEKTSGQRLYFQRDTHWNYYGGFLVANGILSRLCNGANLQNLGMRYAASLQGDLDWMMERFRVLEESDIPFPVFKEDGSNLCNIRRVLWVGDSFSIAPVDILKHSFSIQKIDGLKNFHAKIIDILDRQKFDAVVFEVNERNLTKLLPDKGS
ncbi:MAG: hypothetical protein U1F66_05265 [bacterium]